MKKKFTMSIAILLAVFLMMFASFTFAQRLVRNRYRSIASHLYLFEKDFNDPEWPIITDGAWGKMTYRAIGKEFEYVFNGHKLEPKSDYTLIYYPDPWPGNGLICLGSGTANRNGNLNLADSVNTGDLPQEQPVIYHLDSSVTESPLTADLNNGAKIWLVLSNDVDCDNRLMTAWNPGKYLFEGNLIYFDDIDD